jgi:hypothetical protein
MSESKKHHFVPQSILRRFTNAAADDRLFVYDKVRDASHPSTVLDAGMENHFNVVHLDGERINFEGDFDQPDGAMATVQNRLVDARSLAVLSDADRLVLADTAAVQLLRTKMFRSTMRSVTEAIFSDMERVGLLAGERPELGEQDARAMARAALNERERQRDLLAKLDLILIEPEPGGAFWTSDNPLVRYNQQPYGETGLASPGVEVYWPIASDLAVGFMCPTFSKRIDQGVELGDALEKPVRDQCLAIQTALAAAPTPFSMSCRSGHPAGSSILGMTISPWRARFSRRARRSRRWIRWSPSGALARGPDLAPTCQWVCSWWSMGEMTT